MSVVDRLKRLTNEKSGDAAQREREAKISDVRRRIVQIMERRPGQPPAPPPEPRAEPLQLSAVSRGEEVLTPFGSCYAATGEVHAGSFYGRRRIRELTEVSMRAAALLAGDDRLADFRFDDALFLDTETTGLAGGTGTLAFLVGLGWFSGEAFVTRQLFARDFAEEPAVLSHLAELARDKRFLVTFNGKSFDVGLLSTRFVLNRRRDPLSSLPHLDLLHPSRRLLGHRLTDVRLSTLETEILGVRREGDVLGSEIPQRYFDWLRYRDARLMADVLEHNRLDVISMAMLLVHLAELLECGHDAEAPHPRDLLAAAKLHLERGDAACGEALVWKLVETDDSEVVVEAARLLSLLHKRAGRWPQAIELWEQMLRVDPGDVFAIEELAKWCEHRAGDFTRAIALVSRALDDRRWGERETRERLAYRLDRLQRRSR
jgi:hypothetical protein